MPKLVIDGQEIDAPEGVTVLQAAKMAGIEIPVFCYHDRLKIAGNCRMCLVDVENSPKPVASCAMPAAEGMVVHTTSERTKKARKGVLEFLLINHPLDCPICDQGGECDLQDITMAYGASTSRYQENKRAVMDKSMGPLIKTFMTRCIHCTRCVRFATDVAGVPELGAIGRGEDMEITTYLDRAMASELSGNVIDLCPVGALTSKPYSFRGRPWELVKTESVDVLDAVGSNIRVDSSGLKVQRILPRLHEDINEEWISDKTRFACDGLAQQRLDRPYIRKKGKLEPCTWDEAFKVVKSRIQKSSGDRIAALAGDLVDVESVTALKDLFKALGSPHLDCRQDGAKLDPKYRAGYLFNTTIAGIEKADACLIINSNVRHEAPLINVRLRKRALAGGFKVASLGAPFPQKDSLTYPVQDLGVDPEILSQILSGKHALSKVLKAAKRPMIIVGQEALRRKDGAGILTLAREIAEKYSLVRREWNGFNVLHTAAGRVGALDIGFVPGPKGLDTEGILEAASKKELDLVYLLGTDEIDTSFLKNTFVVYQGHHGDAGAQCADVIFPGAAYTEKNGTYVNTEGRVQHGQKAISPPGEAQEDWRIIRALSEVLGQALPYDTLEQVRDRMVMLNPVFGRIDQIVPGTWGEFGKKVKILSAPFERAEMNFYMTDAISRHSQTMAKCLEEATFNNNARAGTDG